MEIFIGDFLFRRSSGPALMQVLDMGGMDVDAILLLLHAAPGPLQQASREEC